MTTAKKKSLATKLAEVAAECGYVAKASKNDYHGYKYASAEDVLKKVNEALTKRNIAVGSEANVVHITDDGKNAVVKLTLGFYDGDDPEGRPLVVEGLGQGADKGDKAVMKANTAALKYAYANALTISWGDDPEADTGTDKAAAPKKTKTKKPAAKKSDKSVVEQIQAATDVKQLEELKQKVMELRDEDKDKYAEARDAWKAKQKALTEEK